MIVLEITASIEQLDQLSREKESLYRQIAASFGLSDSALCVLYILLFASDAVTQQDICRRCCFPKQTVNTAIAALKKSGCITLAPLPAARGAKRIVLTPAGRELAACSALPLRQAEISAYSSLTPDELQLLIRLSGKLNAALSREFTTLIQGGNHENAHPAL